MSEIKANSVSSYKKTAPIEFPTGFSGDGSGLSTPPEIISFTPQPLSVGISTDTDITIVFDQEIQFSGVGTIFIREGSATGSITESFTCGISTRATISGVGNTILTIDPTQPLGFGTSYYVILPTIGIANTFGQYYSGIETNRYFFRTQNPLFSATGGTYTYTVPAAPSPTGFYRYHIFTGSGPLVLNSPSLEAVNLSMLMIAGGGFSSPPIASGAGGGGGGGGLVTRTGPTLALSAGTYTITVGGGGNLSSISSSPTNIVLVSYAGGSGSPGSPSIKGNDGGSGSGGGSSIPSGSSIPGGSGVSGQGNSGGSSFWIPGPTPITGPPGGYYGGGGGGSGSAGGTGGGGNGAPNPAFASPYLTGYMPPAFPSAAITAIGPLGRFGGGGGGVTGNYPPGTPTLIGGLGGGGGVAPSPSPFSGMIYTGGGGGGNASSSGGSGVFMIRYSAPGP